MRPRIPGQPLDAHTAHTAGAEPAPIVSSPTIPSRPASIATSSFGRVDGREVSLFTMKSATGLVIKVTNYGAIVTELQVPDRAGHLADVVAGYDTLAAYLENAPYFGATVGRVANRIANARFELEGINYELAVNDSPNHLHGGNRGWDKVVWDATWTDTPAGPALALTYESKDGEEGYPGAVTAKVTYALTSDHAFRVDMEATTDRTTIVNMAHHTYWNLAGYDSGSIADHELGLDADEYTPGSPFVPDGAVSSVEGTPFDFRTAKRIGQDLRSVRVPGHPAGYDHNFVVRGSPHALRPVAKVRDPKSGRVLRLEANQPGVQFYAGIFLDGAITGKGHVYRQYDAFCLETQRFPNSINVPAWRNDVILRPGQTYNHVMIHRFSTE